MKEALLAYRFSAEEVEDEFLQERIPGLVERVTVSCVMCDMCTRPCGKGHCELCDVWCVSGLVERVTALFSLGVEECRRPASLPALPEGGDAYGHQLNDICSKASQTSPNILHKS